MTSTHLRRDVLGVRRPAGDHLLAGLAVGANTDPNHKALGLERRPEGGPARDHQAFDQTRIAKSRAGFLQERGDTLTKNLRLIHHLFTR